MIRLIRVYKIWLHGKLGLAKRMRDFNEYRKWFFSFYGFYPTSVRQINDFFTERYMTIKNHTP